MKVCAQAVCFLVNSCQSGRRLPNATDAVGVGVTKPMVWGHSGGMDHILGYTLVLWSGRRLPNASDAVGVEL